MTEAKQPPPLLSDDDALTLTAGALSIVLETIRAYALLLDNGRNAQEVAAMMRGTVEGASEALASIHKRHVPVRPATPEALNIAPEDQSAAQWLSTRKWQVLVDRNRTCARCKTVGMVPVVRAQLENSFVFCRFCGETYEFQ